jgi:hypothetical protein
LIEFVGEFSVSRFLVWVPVWMLALAGAGLVGVWVLLHFVNLFPH